MHIQTPTEITEPIFSGYLELPGETFREERTLSDIGRPEWWFAREILGESFKPPQGDETYLLVRLAFSLMPPKNHEIDEAQLTALLTCPRSSLQPVVFDLFPREVLDESKTDVKVTLGPSLKLKEAQASAGSIEASIQIPKVEPILTTSGVGGTKPTWFYRKHKRHPILGTRMVYAVIGFPSAAETMTIQLGLTARVRGRFGLLTMALPSTEEAKVTRTIP
jgi:hypothetical protein